MQDLRKLLEQAASCGAAHDMSGCLAALRDAVPLLAAPSTDPQREIDLLQTARMAALAGDEPLALSIACLLLQQVCSVSLSDGIGPLVSANLRCRVFVPFVRSNSWLQAQSFTGFGAFLVDVLQRIRPDLDAAGWSDWDYPEALAVQVRNYAAAAAVNLGRVLYAGPAREDHSTAALALAQVSLDTLGEHPTARSSQLIASDAYCLIGRVLLASANEGGDLERALAAFEASLDIQTSVGSAGDVAVDQSNAGALCIRIAERYEAEAQGERARARRAAAEGKADIASAATVAAEQLSAKARAAWQRATALLDAAKPFILEHPGSLAASVLVNSAAARAQLGDRPAARADLEQALKLGDAASKTMIQLQRGRLEMDAKDYVEAEKALAEALRGKTALVPSERAFLEGSYGEVLRQLKRSNEALGYLKNALDGIEAIGRASFSVRVGIAMLKTHRWIPEAYIACCAELDRPELAERAFEVAETVRWRIFSTATRYHAIPWHGTPHPLLAEEAALLERIKSTELGSPENAVEDSVAAAFARLDAIWKELAAIDPGYVALRRREPVAAGQVSDFLDATVTALVVYYLGEEIDELALAWVFRRDEPRLRLVRLPCKADTAATAVDALRAANDSQPPAAFNAAAGRLHAALIAPLSTALPASGGVCFVPHGPLHNVPFGALFDGQHYFIETRAVVVAPSVAGLRWARRHNGGLDASRSLIVAATGGAVINQEKAMDLSLFDALARQKLVPLLPGSRLVPQEQATKPYLLQQFADGTSWDILHIAGHGLFETLLPDGSLAGEGLAARLVLTGPASDDRDWTALEIAVSAEPRGALVVLSACESGVSTAATNDELFGLAHAFLFAGSASILASMWYVVQQHGVELTRKFYANLFQGERVQSRVDALRQAQLDSMRDTQWFGLMKRQIHPYTWAAFQLMGDWRRHSGGGEVQ